MANITKDKLWKGIIYDFPQEFLAYFFPEHIDLFDIERGIEFLDKEL